MKHFRQQLEGYNFTIFTDHRLLIFAFTKTSDSRSPVQLGHLDFVSQFSTDIRHVSKSDNSMADTHSGIILNLSTADLQYLADTRTNDEEFKTLVSFNDCSINLKHLKMERVLLKSSAMSKGKKVQSWVPEKLSVAEFRFLHNLPNQV
ncbi:transposon Tf2-6 polyprotein [Trichonephila clavipes]|nr:transposon Tf2-6 polyprotein [Trichonephila clavipes]